MNIHDFKKKKQQQANISMLTCYDYPSARIIAETAVDTVLVGDSVAMAVHGHESTIMATLDMMVMHTAAVARGLGKQFLVSDLPFLSYRGSLSETINSVKQLLQAGAHAVKLEGADTELYQTIKHLTRSGVPVMGHIGLTPQSVHQLGGYRVQGKNAEQAQLLLQQASDLEVAGCFAVVLECMPLSLAKQITESISIPTIGIGSGPETDGQVLVWHDVLGLHTDLNPRFVKTYLQGKVLQREAVETYADHVHRKMFPTVEHSY